MFVKKPKVMGVLYILKVSTMLRKLLRYLSCIMKPLCIGELLKQKNCLHTMVSYLRTTLAALGYLNAVQYVNGYYILQLDHFHGDVLELEQLLKEKEEFGKLAVEKAEVFIQNYKGEFMATLDYAWIHRKSNYIHNQLTLLLSYLVEHYTIND